MKCLLINLIVFVIAVNSDTLKPLFRPQLPIGEYQVKILGLLRCESSTNRFKFNLYLSKTSANTTEVKGNLTYYEPLDDSLNIEINMAIKDSVGGWKDNAHMFKAPKACSSLKWLTGKTWTTVTKSLGMHIANCPIPAGCYVVSGLKHDRDLYDKLPKQFFYGTYKLRFQFTKNKVVHGCLTSVLEIKRPWETD